MQYDVAERGQLAGATSGNLGDLVPQGENGPAVPIEAALRRTREMAATGDEHDYGQQPEHSRGLDVTCFMARDATLALAHVEFEAAHEPVLRLAVA